MNYCYLSRFIENNHITISLVIRSQFMQPNKVINIQGPGVGPGSGTERWPQKAKKRTKINFFRKK